MRPLYAGDGVAFEHLDARELADAREEVLGWAYDLHADQAEAAAANKRASHRDAKPAATRAECLAKSIEIRRKRERDATYWNDLTNPHPIH